eukprot:916921-Amphidinium_carterae.1
MYKPQTRLQRTLRVRVSADIQGGLTTDVANQQRRLHPAHMQAVCAEKPSHKSVAHDQNIATRRFPQQVALTL